MRGFGVEPGGVAQMLICSLPLVAAFCIGHVPVALSRRGNSEIGSSTLYETEQNFAPMVVDVERNSHHGPLGAFFVLWS